MKNLNYYSRNRGSLAALQSNDVGYDCRSTVVRPSFDRRSSLLKLVSVLVLVLTIGVGQMWGTAASLPIDYTFGDNSYPTGTSGNSLTLQGYVASHDPYRLQFNGTGDYLLLETDSPAKQIIFGVKKIGGAGNSTFTVKGSADNNTFTDIESFSITGSQNAVVNCTTTVSIDASYRYFRFYFTKSANVGFGTLKVSKAEKYTITYDAGSGTCGTSTWTQTSVGQSTTLPSATPGCDGWSFAGWCTSSAGSTNNNTTSPGSILTGSYTPSSNVTLYAVYTKSGGGGSSNVTFNFGYSSDWGQSGSWSGTSKNEVSAIKGGVTVTYTRNGSNLYANSTSIRFYQKNTLTFAASNPITAISFTVSTYQTDITSDVGTCTATSSELSWSGSATSVTFTRPSGASSYAQMSVAAITMSVSTTYYMTNYVCCTQLGSINGSVSRTTPTTATLSWDAVSGAEKYQVKVPGSSSHNDWTDATSGVSVTGLSCGTAYTAYFRAIDTNGTHCSTGPESTESVPASSWTVTSTGVTNATASPAIPSTTCNGFSTTITAATGYALPSSITVTNATKSWTQGTGALTISSVTGNVTITITPTCVSPVVTADPDDADYYIGDDPEELSVTATLASGTRTYLWKVSTNGGSTWSDAAGTNNLSTYSGASLSTASAGTTKFKCIVGNSEGGCTVESAVATITVTAASNFTNGATLFIQAGTTSAWHSNACVKAWFHSTNSDGAAQDTYWLFDVTSGGDNGKKLFATIVPSTGDLPYVDLQRFPSGCEGDMWNYNGGVSKSAGGASNAIRSEGYGENQVYWNASSVTMELWSSIDSWEAKKADITDQGSGIWRGTYSNYTPDATSADFKIKTNYNGWIGNTNSNDNATLSDMIVGSTYNVTATLDVTDHSLVMSKTFVKGTVHFNLKGHGSAIDDLTNVTAGSKISAPSAPTAAGWHFIGWYKEDACTNAWNFASDVVNETMTLYAKWVQTFTVTYDANGGSGTITDSNSPYDTGSTVTVKNSTGFTGATGKEFDHWDTKDDDSGIDYAPNATFTISANTTLYAQWRNINYNVTYSAPSYGNYTIKVADGSASSETKTANYNQTITIAATPSSGCRFDGWTITNTSTSADVTSTLLTGDKPTTASTTFTMPAYGVTVTASFTQGATVVLSEAGNESTISGTRYAGDSYTLPTTAADCPDVGLYGWYKGEYEHATTAPSGANFYLPGATATLTGGENKFYAVYATIGDPADTYTLITSTGELVTGDYLLAGKISNYYGMKNSFYSTNSTMNDAQLTVSDGVASDPDVTQIWRITKSTNTITIYSENSSKYFGFTSNHVALMDDSQDLSYELSDGKWAIYAGSDYLTYSTYFQRGSSKVYHAYLFKRDQSISGPYTTSPVCVTHDLDVVSDPVAGGTAEAVKTILGETKTTTATATPNEHYTFSHWTISGTGSSMSNTSEGKSTDNPVTVTMGTEDATLTAHFTEKAKCTVVFKNNGTQVSSNTYWLGENPEAPTLTDGTSHDACDATSDKHYGWTRNTITGSVADQATLDARTGLDVVYTKAATLPAITAGDDGLTLTYHAVWAKATGGGYAWSQATTVSVGDEVVIAEVDDGTEELSGFNTTITTDNNYGTGTTFSTNPAGTLVWTVEAGSSTGQYSFKNGDYYLRLGSSNNYLSGNTSKNSNSSWNVTESNSRAKITSASYATRSIMYKTSGRFACYAKSHGEHEGGDGTDYYYVIFYKRTAGTVYSTFLTTCCDKSVELSDGTLSHCSISFSNANPQTCSSTDSERQVTITVTPDAGYEMTSEARLTFNKTSGTATATYVSGPTGSGPYTFVYQFTKDDNGEGTFDATCTAKTYRITLNNNGATTAGTEYVDVVYNTAPATFTPPTKEGYNFQGYWTNTGSPSWGYKLGNNGGTWAPNIAYYTSGGNWIRAENVTLNAKWEEKLLQNYRTECPSFEVYNQDGTSAADIHLTSTKDVEIYASEAAGNLIRIIASGLDANGNHPKIGVEYYDANNGDALVTGTDRVFRLCSSSTYNTESDLLDLGENTTAYDQTFSISYTPGDYNQSHHYKLKLILRNNNTEKDNVTIDLYGRSLPKEFVIAAKSGDTWYALPNTLAATEGGQGAISPTAITVDNATTPTKVVNPVGTVIYGACNKYTNANRSGLRFTSDGAHWIQTSSTASAYKMWLSNSGGSNVQDWYLKSSDLSAYEVFMDPIGSPSDKRRIELYNSTGVKMGYHNTGATHARTGVGNVYLLPVEFPSITARIMEWGTDHVVVELRTPGSSTKVKTQIGGGAIGDEQSLASVKKDEGVYRLAVSLSSSDALKDLKLYFYNISDVLQGVAAFTIPRIVSSTTTTGSFGTPFKKDAPFVDLVVLNGATLTVSETTDGTKFTFRDLYVYGNAKMVVPSGTYIEFSNVYLRGGHLNSSWNYVYSHPQLVLNGTMGNTSNTINYDYLTNNSQFYSLALPYEVTLSNIVNPDFNNKQSWLIHAYDGALRASGSQVSGWYDVEEGSTEGDIDPLGSSDALTAGVGYTFFGAPQKVNSIRQKWSVNRFPMTLASGSAEVAKSGVSVTAHGMTESAGVYTLNDGVAPNDAGWNMLGNPFLADIGGTETYETAVKGTILSYHNVKTMDASGNWTGGWHWEENETNVRYVRIPNDLGTEYEQVRFKDATLRAFHHFFIQAGATGTFNFDLATRAQSMPQRIKRGKLLLPEEMDVDFRLSKGEASTKFGLTLCDDFSSDYVMNEDIAEDLSGEAMKAYTLILDQRVTYNGLPFTAAQQIIPVGFRAPNAGEYTFSYQEDENSENIEHIYLTDMRLGVVTDLKDNTYKFASEIGVVDNRLVLQIVFSSNVTTDVEETFEQENGRPLKFLYQGKIYILRNGILYDITGKRVREINK